MTDKTRDEKVRKAIYEVEILLTACRSACQKNPDDTIINIDKKAQEALQTLLDNAPYKIDEKEIRETVIEWFINLERKQSAEQIEEVNRKGLWNADLKSATFEEIANGLACTIIQKLEEKEPTEKEKDISRWPKHQKV